MRQTSSGCRSFAAYWRDESRGQLLDDTQAQTVSYVRFQPMGAGKTKELG